MLLNSDSFPLARTRQNIAAILDKQPYGLVARTGTFYLFKRGHVSTETNAAMTILRAQLGR